MVNVTINGHQWSQVGLKCPHQTCVLFAIAAEESVSSMLRKIHAKAAWPLNIAAIPERHVPSAVLELLNSGQHDARPMHPS